jgi:hypothetical protein
MIGSCAEGGALGFTHPLTPTGTCTVTCLCVRIAMLPHVQA